MKDKIHPTYVDCVITCSCGKTINTRSTKPKLSVDICSACHPFFTGKQKLVDAAGRVEKFRRRFGDTAPTKVKATPKPKRAPIRKAEKQPKAPKTAKPKPAAKPTKGQESD